MNPLLLPVIAAQRLWVRSITPTVPPAAGTAFGPVALAFGLLALPSAGPGTLSAVLAGQAVPHALFVVRHGRAASRMNGRGGATAAGMLQGTRTTGQQGAVHLPNVDLCDFLVSSCCLRRKGRAPCLPVTLTCRV